VSRPGKRFIGRGAQIRPDNRFAPLRRAPLDADDTVEIEDSELVETETGAAERLRTTYLPDESCSVVTENQSPDLNFRYSLNPYRGCAHGCSYCYARPTHEYLGFDAGLDFESKILVKHRAPELFRNWLGRERYVCEPIMFSGVTDCYQPAERQFGLTRACLQVAAEAGQPVTIVTKNALVARDLDLLQPMAALEQAQVSVSITTLDQQLARVMEPRTSSPAARLATLRRLHAAGIPTQVLVAPVIPGLNDHEIPAVLQAAREHGAEACGYTVLRLPRTVRPVFLDWLERSRPLQADRVKARIQAVRGGAWNDAQFGLRHRGSGPLAEQIAATFKVFAKRLGFAAGLSPLNTIDFRPPRADNGQRWLF
jgi:DNA repair photolyase